MGTFNWPIEILSADGRRSVRVEALVDTGASYTTLPAEMLKGLGIEPANTRQFELADGRIVDLEIGDAVIRLGGEEHPRVVVFGNDPATNILGADTLQGAGLVVDPANHRLLRINSLLKPIPSTFRDKPAVDTRQPAATMDSTHTQTVRNRT